MDQYSTVVVGGGAAGICAAISASRKGERVIICEKTAQIGKKILASGNGRCNLLNEDMSESNYNSTARSLVKPIFSRIGKKEILDFFKDLGLEVYSREGRIFPVTNQAASVLKVLEMELKRLSIPVEYDFNCSTISFAKEGILVSSGKGQKISCRKVIITGGGQTYPAYGSDGSTYLIAQKLGHSIVKTVPAAVPLVVKDPVCNLLQGQRIQANVRSVIEGRPGNAVEGELLFTKYGLSGTCILDVSEEISIAINRNNLRDAIISVDLIPFMDKGQLKKELEKRKSHNIPAEEMLIGILPNKVSAALKNIVNNDLNSAANSLKDRRFKVAGTRGWNEAEFTSGGISVNEINPATLESKLHRNVYFAGEILDVNGRRGGYNLGWAWASGLLAGGIG
jgi:predicted Rossmann fold flavoprotein